MTNSVLTGDVRQTLDHFRRSVDQLFENFYGFPAETGRTMRPARIAQWIFSPAVETAWGDSTLNLRAIRSRCHAKRSEGHRSEQSAGNRGRAENAGRLRQRTATRSWPMASFTPLVTLAAGLDLDKMNCRLHDGVLDIQIPVSEKMRPRQIQIQTGEQRKSISA